MSRPKSLEFQSRDEFLKDLLPLLAALASTNDYTCGNAENRARIITNAVDLLIETRKFINEVGGKDE